MKRLLNWLRTYNKRNDPPRKATFAGRPIRSDFVLNRLRNTNWKDHMMILDLIRLERYVQEGPSGWIDAMRCGAVKQRYPEETAALEAELLTADELVSLKQHRAQVQQTSLAAQEADMVKEKNSHIQLKLAWLALSGKP